MKLAPAVSLLSIVLTVATGAASCGGDGPTAPASPHATIQTAAGTLTVVAEGCVPDLEAMRREVDGVVRRSGLTASLDGWVLYARTPEATREVCDGEACLDERGRTMHVWCPVAAHQAGGTEHEVGHALAYVAGLGCWREIGHGVGFDCKAAR